MDQNKALSILKTGKNVFLTGSAGTGKTFVLNQYIQYLKERKIPVAVTASTGIAATHMNGMTIHSWSGIGVKNKLSSRDLKNLTDKKYLKTQLEKSKVLIIDEISMLHKNQLDMVNQVLKHFKNNDKPFGGIQVVLSGDFFQLPPISDDAVGQKFAFMSQAWVEAKLVVCYLTQQYRQENNALTDILNEIRSGAISQDSINKLTAAEKTKLNDALELTKLYTHNEDVDTINNRELVKLDGKLHNFKAETKGNPKIIETMSKSVQAPVNLQLKKGAKVMFVKNNPEKGTINGTTGVVEGFNDEGYPKVKLLSGKIITVKEDTWSVQNDKGSALAKFNQIPLRLAWAITVHKSQGLTLDAAEIDLSRTFEKGQGYVALSRLKSLENLKLIGFNQQALAVDALALKADKRFQELSDEASNTLKEDELQQLGAQFVKDSGGLTSKEAIQKEVAKLKRKKIKKSTYEQTRELVDKSISIPEIASIRGYSEGTIISHILKLKSTDPDLKLDAYKPKASVLKKITPIYNELKKKTKAGETVKLTPIFKKMEGELSYDEIKLALLFL